MNKFLKFGIQLFVSVLIIAFLVHYIGFDNIVGVLRQANWWWVIPAVLAFFLNFIFNALNLYTLANVDGKCVGFFSVLKYYVFSMAISLFVPGLFGQASIMLFFRKHLSTSKCFAMFFLDKLWIFVIVSALVILGAILFVDVRLVFGVLLCVFIVLCVMFLFSKTCNRFFMFFLPKFIKKRFSAFFEVLEKYPENKSVVFRNLLYSVTRWFFKGLCIYFLFLALNQSIPLYYILPIMALEALSALIPISLSGLGVRESIGIALYQQVGVSSPVAGAMYLINNILVYAIGVTCLFFVKGGDFSWSAIFAKEKK